MNILLVDDHTLFREGMRFLLQGLDNGLALDECDAVDKAVVKISQNDYDLILLDLKMPGYDNLDALVAVKEIATKLPIVVLSGEDSPPLIRQAIEVGAMGFIPKSSSHDVLMQALNLVIAGGVYLPVNAIADTDVASEAPVEQVKADFSGLTPRQIEVLHGVVKGQPNKLIARELDVSEHTIKAHLSAVYRALGAKNRTDAVYQAARLQVLLAP